MMLTMGIILSSFLLSLIFVMITLSVSKKSVNLREKWTPFECGFSPFNLSRLPFSMRFFLIAIIFIVFDVEIVLIMPLTTSIFTSSISKWFLTTSMILLIILMGLLIEWKETSLEWKQY